jgi:hypothetical protein
MSRAGALATVLFAALAAGAAGQGAPLGGAMPEEASSSGSARPIRCEVSDYRDVDGKRWIHMVAEFEGEIPCAMDEIIGTLWDFEGSPRMFSRIEAIRVRSDDGSVAVTEQRTGVRVLGFSFISNLVFKSVLERPAPAKAEVGFEMVESDGSCLASRGGWLLEDRGEAGRPSTYLRYSLDSLVEPRFPGQATILRMFLAGDIRKLFRELGAAAVKKSGRG